LPEFRSGFVALIGSPNVGKSTLLNRIVGTKISIVSKKPQTTRTKISGILTRKDFQIIFLDTPGIHPAKNALDEIMLKTIESAITDVDVVLYIMDAKTGLRESDRDMIGKLSKQKAPFFVLINKTDAVEKNRLMELMEELGTENKVCPISAKLGDGVDEMLLSLQQLLPEGPKYYPEDMVTDQPERLIAAEIIREKALKHLGKEVPHGVGVEIERVDIDAAKDIVNIDAVIYCERDSHKGIIIGRGGSKLKKIASEARIDIQVLFGQKVFLRVWVKVKRDWRNQDSVLRTLGYKD
jgi:GTP-binding protein Era